MINQFSAKCFLPLQFYPNHCKFIFHVTSKLGFIYLFHIFEGPCTHCFWFALFCTSFLSKLQLEQEILNFSEGLRVIGVKPDEKLALFADNSCRWLIADQGGLLTVLFILKFCTRKLLMDKDNPLSPLHAFSTEFPFLFSLSSSSSSCFNGSLIVFLCLLSKQPNFSQTTKFTS